MNTMQKLFYSGVASLTVIHSTSAQSTAGGNAATKFGLGEVKGSIIGSDKSAENSIQLFIGNALKFLGIVAVLYGIYGGFLIMTAGGDDGKVKTGKTILIQVVIGLVVIFLAYSIVNWIFTGLLSNV